MSEGNHISEVRQLLLDQLRALRAADAGTQLESELKRAKGVGDIAQTLINSAKVEVDYLVATDQTHTPFLEVPLTPNLGLKQNTTTCPGESNGITSITRHRLK